MPGLVFYTAQGIAFLPFGTKLIVIPNPVRNLLYRLRTRLASKELEEEFAAANELYRILRDLQ